MGRTVESMPSQRPFNPYVALVIVIVTCALLGGLVWIALQIIAGFPLFFARNWLWFVPFSVVMTVGISAPWLVPMIWRGYVAREKHRAEMALQYSLHQIFLNAAANTQAGYDTKYHNALTGHLLEVTAPKVGRVTSIKETDEMLALPAPECIPAIVKYEDIADEVPIDMSLLGIHPSDGALELTDWEKLKCLWLVGSSSTGKSNTIFGKAREAVSKLAKLLVIDQHSVKLDSLARKLEPLKSAFLGDIAVKDEEVLQALAWFKAEFERRVQCPICATGTQCERCSQKIVLVCDEMNRMVRNDKLKKQLQEIVAICGEESRGFGMYGWFLSQKCAGLKWLRDSAITVIAHRLTRFEEALLACNDDRQAAKRLLEFKVGRTYIYGVDFDEPMELQQPLYALPVISPSVKSSIPASVIPADSPSSNRPALWLVEEDSEEAPKWKEEILLSEQEKRIGEMFFIHKMNPSAIVKEFYGSRGGDAYQKASASVTEAIRKYAEWQRGA